MSVTEQEVILSDLSGCLPGDALTAAPGKPGTWMLFAYETEAVGDLPTFAGNMIYGAGRLESPPLSLPLPVAGWYSIYVGCWHNIHVGGSSLRLQLRQDRFYRQLEPERVRPKDGDFPGHEFGPADLTEVFWRVAYLEAEELRIDRVRLFNELSGRGDQAADRDACLAWVRLRPASQAERDRYEGRGATTVPTTQFGQYDNGNWFQKGCTTDDDLRASIDWFAGSDMHRLLWGCYANEGTCYPSDVAETMARDAEVTRCIQEFRKRGVDPLAVALEHAGEVGVELYPSFRPRRMPARARLLRALEYYEAGAQGFCFWDGQSRVVRASEFASGRFLGHREDLARWAEEMEEIFRVIPMRTLQGYTMDRRYWTLTSG